jgi:predicted TIM-barrel fold metal-dependent hydrolase
MGSRYRRKLLQGLALLPFLARRADAQSPEINAFRRAAIEGWRKRILAIHERGTVPIIDTEATYNAAINIDSIRGSMDSLGVAQVCFAPFAGLGSRASYEIHIRHPEYFIPTTADGSSPHWYQNTERFAESTRQDLSSGQYFLMGEFEIRHYPSHQQVLAGRLDRDITVPLQDPGLQAIFRLAEQTGIALQIHYEIEDGLLTGLEALLERYPLAKVIWCHLGQVRYAERNTRYGSDYVANLIKRFPNLYFDLGIAGPTHHHPGSRQRDQTIYAETRNPPWGGYLRADWRTILESYPDRFLAASDIDASRWQNFNSQIERLRALILDRLTPRTRHMIAYQNAWRLITGEPHENWRNAGTP